MNQPTHAFSVNEAPTTPASRGARRTLGSIDDEAPTTLRRSSTIRARTAPRATPPPLPRKSSLSPPRPPPLPPRASQRPTQAVAPLAPTLPPARIRSLASILEPMEEEPCVVAPARFLVLPPDPDVFGVAPPESRASSRESLRWLLRIALVLVVLTEELILAAPAGALHPPRDVTDAATMLGSAIRSSVVTALGR